MAFTEDHYRTLVESIDHGICTIEVLFDGGNKPIDYRFLDVNPAFERQTGLRDVVGRRMRELAPAHEDHWFEIYGRIAVTGRPERFEQRAAALNRWFDVYAFRVGDPAQRRVGVLFTDVSASKQTQDALRRSESSEMAARREAERANGAKDEFVAMLAHELRNACSPMLTALALMRLRGHESREQDVLERQVGQLTRLVDDLLDISRVARGTVSLERRPIEMSDVVLRAMEIAGPMIEQRQSPVELSVPKRGLRIDADLDRMAQVVSNLLTNAAKYSPVGSPICVTAARDGATVRLRVRDDGIGIAPEMQDHVFDAFVQQPEAVKQSHGGLGLGLAVVRSLVNALGGRVRVESAGVNRGSEFIVELPAAAEAAV